MMDLSQISHGSDQGSPQAPVYIYRASPLGAPYTYRLTDKGLGYEAGRQSGVVPYADIRRIRLSYKPGSTVPQRFMTEVWAAGRPKLTMISTTWTGLMVQERQDKNYSAFVAELHRRVAATGPAVVYERGTLAVLYWPGIFIFIAFALSMASLVVRGLQAGIYAGAAFILAFLALFLWQGGNFFRRNKPGVYTADALPGDLLP